MRKNHSKENKLSCSRPGKSGQTGQTGRTSAAKCAAKLDKQVRSGPLQIDRDTESLSAGEAARELGISSRTLRRLCSTGQLPSFSTPGGQVRVWRAQLDAYRQGLYPRSGSAPSSAVENRRETLQNLTLELQERRLRRDLKKLEDDDADAERHRGASIEAEQLRSRATIEQAREQREAREEQHEREREQAEADQRWQQWADAWLEFALKSLPHSAPREVVSAVQHEVEEALMNMSTEPTAVCSEGSDCCRDREWPCAVASTAGDRASNPRFAKTTSLWHANAI